MAKEIKNRFVEGSDFAILKIGCFSKTRLNIPKQKISGTLSVENLGRYKFDKNKLNNIKNSCECFQNSFLVFFIEYILQGLNRFFRAYKLLIDTIFL